MDYLLERLKNYTLLFVENEIGIRENFSEYFNLIFKETFIASDGEDGFNQYLQHKPDFIITDIKMPKMDGIELVKKIRQIDENTSIALISAHTDVEFLLLSIPLGLVEYVVKPINENKLQDLFQKFLQKVENRNFFYNQEKSEITFNNETYSLSYKENLFVNKLVHQNKVISYEEIECDIWDEKEMSPNALRIFIKNLRKKLPQGFIKNVTNLGYTLGI